MRAMILSDLLTVRNMLLQLLGICIVVGLVMCYAMETVAGGMTAIAAMTPFTYLFSLAALDEQNGWERFRLALPISRRHVVFGRYVSLFVVAIGAALFAVALGLAVSVVAEALADGQPDSVLTALSFTENPPLALLGSTCLGVLVIFVGTTVALPLIARFGMTRAVRIAPLVVIFALALGIGLFGDNVPLIGFFSDIDAWIAAGDYAKIAGAVGIVFAATMALYAASALLSAKLYESREF